MARPARDVRLDPVKPVDIGSAETIPISGDDTADHALPGPGIELDTVAVNRYRIDREIARGGLGRILHARDERLGRSVALKELLDVSDHTVARFLREAAITARLQHPAIVPIYEAGYWPNGDPFYAMKLVSGNTLKEAIQRASSFAERLALLPHVIAVTDAMAYAHACGVIHRDLKPSNILIGEYGETVVVDWGLAKLVGDDDDGDQGAGPAGPSDAELTVAGAVLGTPAYMAPEQARGDEADTRADVYALGAILYAALSGRAPHAVGSADELVAHLADGTFAPPPLPDDVAPDLADIAAKAMSQDPARRYRDAGELAADLKRFQTGQLVRAHHYTFGALLLRWLKRHRVAIALAVVILTATGVALGLGLDSAHQRRLAARAIARGQTEAARALLVKAEQRLAADPTEALALLKQLPEAVLAREGNHVLDSARQLALDGVHRGVARHVLGDHRAQVWSIDAGGRGDIAVSTLGDGDTWLWNAADGTLRAALRGHDKMAYALARSPDGSVFASGGSDAIVQEWDATTGVARRRLSADEVITDMAYGADGTLAVATIAGTLTFFAPGDRSGPVALVLPSSGGTPTVASKVAWSPAGDAVVAVCADGVARVWEWPSRQLLRAVGGADSPVRTMAFGPEGKRLVVAGAGVRVVDVRTGAARTLARTDGAAVVAVAFAPDGRHVAAASDAGTLRVWAMPVGEVVATLSRPGTIEHVAFSPDGAAVIASTERGEVIGRDLVLGRDLSMTGHAGTVRAVGFLADGSPVSGSSDYSVRVWADGRSIRALAGPGGRIEHAVFTPDDRYVLAGDVDGVLWRWRVGTGEGIALRDVGHRIEHVEVDPTGGRVAVVSAGGTELVDVATGEARRIDDRHALCSAFSPDGSQLAIGRHDGVVALWADRTGEARPAFSLTKPIQQVRFSPDGTLLAALDYRDIRLWNLTAGAAVALRTPPRRPDYLAFSLDGTRLAAASDGREVHLWNARTGAGRILQSNTGQITKVTFAPDGTVAAIGSNDRRVWLWEPDAEAPRVLRSHPDRVSDVDFSPTGDWLGSISADGTVQLVAARATRSAALSHDVVLQLPGQRELAYSHDGLWLLASGQGAPQLVSIDVPRAPAAFLSWLGSHTSARIAADGRVFTPAGALAKQQTAVP